MSTDLTDRERAAAFVRGASPEEREQVLAHLSPSNRQRLVREAEALDLPMPVCRAIVEEVLGLVPRPPAPRPLFAGWRPLEVADFLEAQHPQIAVCLLARMEPGSARAAMDVLEETTRLEVVERLQAMGGTDAPEGSVSEALVAHLVDTVRALPVPSSSLPMGTRAEQSPEAEWLSCGSVR